MVDMISLLNCIWYLRRGAARALLLYKCFIAVRGVTRLFFAQRITLNQARAARTSWRAALYRTIVLPLFIGA